MQLDHFKDNSMWIRAIATAQVDFAQSSWKLWHENV